MNCHTIVFIVLLGLLLCCKASREHNKKGRSHTHVHRSTEHKKIPAYTHNKSQENNEAKLHKKEEMLGQDLMRINDAEFKLQSLVSPEFHQGSNALHKGRSFGSMEVNTLSPEQVDFVQSTAQWPKFSNPESKNKDASRTVYPENPVLFPHEQQRQNNNFNNNNWITLGGNSLKQLSNAPFDDMPTGNVVSMGNDMGGNMGGNMGNNMGGNINTMFQEQPQQKANTMQFDVKPGYTTTADAPIDDKMTPFSDFGGIKIEAKNPLGFGGRSKMSALLNEGIMNPRGKPIGILGNILKASQEMPTGKVMKPSVRSNVWLNDGPFSRRHKLERSHKSSVTHKPTPSLKHIFKEHKKKSKTGN